jgi:hypothetical protein
MSLALPFHRKLILLLSVLGLAVPLSAQSNNEVTNERRINAFPHYPIKGNLSGFGYAGWVKNPDNEYTLWYGGFPGVIYSAKTWLQVWGGFLNIYTNNYTDENGKQDTLELRPFIG